MWKFGCRAAEKSTKIFMANIGDSGVLVPAKCWRIGTSVKDP
jgi:hypothetical protein